MVQNKLKVGLAVWSPRSISLISTSHIFNQPCMDFFFFFCMGRRANVLIRCHSPVSSWPTRSGGSVEEATGGSPPAHRTVDISWGHSFMQTPKTSMLGVCFEAASQAWGRGMSASAGFSLIERSLSEWNIFWKHHRKMCSRRLIRLAESDSSAVSVLVIISY